MASVTWGKRRMMELAEAWLALDFIIKIRHADGMRNTP
jgi:hypothetical protein